jgi:hypothetical protein
MLVLRGKGGILSLYQDRPSVEPPTAEIFSHRKLIFFSA